MKNFIFKLSFIFASLVISSCSDDDNQIDNIPPSLDFISPTHLQNFAFSYDPLEIEPVQIDIEVRDNVSIAGVQLEITNDEGEVVATYFTPYNISFYEFIDTFIPEEAGNYHFQCRVEDSAGNVTLSEVISIAYTYTID
jgi:hypothetical protein